MIPQFNIKKLIQEKDHLRGWGTAFDDMDTKEIPPQFIGSFYEASHDQIEKFMWLSDDDKWAMAYWIERQAFKSGSGAGIRVGTVIGVIIGLVLSAAFFSIF